MPKFCSFPLRLALHTGFPGRKDHIDCFIDAKESEGLVSYQTKSLPEGFAELGLWAPKLHFGLSNESETPGLVFPQALHKIAAHRPEYMDFSGPLDNNRGQLIELCKGYLFVPEGYIWPDRILLKLIED